LLFCLLELTAEMMDGPIYTIDWMDAMSIKEMFDRIEHYSNEICCSKFVDRNAG